MAGSITAEQSLRVLRPEQRLVILASVLMIGLLNTFICLLHCMLTPHAADFKAPGHSNVAYFCGLPIDVPGSTSNSPGEGLSKRPRNIVAVFFGGTDGLEPPCSAVITDPAVRGWLIAPGAIAQDLLAFPPLSPPPRMA